MRKATSGWGWLAAGVLALGVNGFMHDDGADLARRVADRVVARAEAILVPVSGRADEFLAKVRMAAARDQVQSCRLGSAMVRIQSTMTSDVGFARLQAMSAREEAQLARMEANRARVEAQAARFELATEELDAPKIAVICPRVLVNVPQPVVRIPVPVVHVRTGGAGSV